MTMVTTKIDPITIPGLESGTTTFQSVCHAEAPASRAASISARSIRLMELKIGTIMNMVYRCTKATITEKFENSSHSTGAPVSPAEWRNELKVRQRPGSSATHPEKTAA